MFESEFSTFGENRSTFFLSQNQISASFLINLLALGTGASYGIANVLLASMAEDTNSNGNGTNKTEKNVTTEYGSWDFTVNSEEASWIGKFQKNIFLRMALNF